MVRAPGRRAVPEVHADRARHAALARGLRDRARRGLLKRPIALLGLRCAGKSTVGKLLAARLGLDFCDSDEELARREGSGRSAGELLAELGEPAFRRREWLALGALLEADAPSVIATGGGVVTDALSRELLARRTIGVYLAAAPQTLRERAAASSTLRPALLAGGAPLSLERQLELREPLYRSLASLVIETSDRTPAEIAEQIASKLRSGRPS